MRYYVTSNDLGREPERFVDLVGGPGARVAVLANSIDDRSDEVRTAAVGALIEQISGLGVLVAELDLRAWFGSDDPDAALDGLDGVWCRGGNTFLLRAALRLSGMDDHITRRVRGGQLVWGGASAGAIVLAPSLRGVEQMNDPSAVEVVYGVLPTWQGLGVLDHAVIPHFRSGHVESPAADAMAERYLAEHVPFVALRDGEFLTNSL